MISQISFDVSINNRTARTNKPSVDKSNMNNLSAFHKNLLVIFFASLCGLPIVAQDAFKPNVDRAVLFDEVIDLVAEHFYDRSFNEKAWRLRAEEFRKKAVEPNDLDQFSSQVNQLLATLKTSHTFFYSRKNPKHFQLMGVFNRLFDQEKLDLFMYDGIGINTSNIENKMYVSSVFDGFPAKRAGIRFGDVIRSVDGKPFHPINSFKNLSGKKVKLTIVRGQNAIEQDVRVQRIDGRRMFETAMKASAKILESNGKKIGYIHVWSYAGQKYQDILREHLLWGKLSECDSLILDIRDGWGGADLNYLNLFRPPIAIVTSMPRRGKQGSYSGVWEKPVVLLTNGRSTSGKELFTYGFKKLKIGKVIGEKTAGAVVAGRIFQLSSDDVLYLAVNDVSVDGQRIEGVGIQPDIEVRRDILSSSEKDPQLQKAIDVISK